MATTSNLVSLTTSTFDKGGQDRFTLRYLVEFDTRPTNPYTALAIAQLFSTTPDAVPRLRAVYPGRSNIFVSSIAATPTNETRAVYYYDVTYAVPEPNAQEPFNQDPNPTLRPGQRNIEYIASEYVIDAARNVQVLPHGDGDGGSRGAGVLGPIVNAAGKREDSPKVDTEYNAVLVWTKNYATLGAIDTLNQTYQRTTNSDEVLGYDPHRLKYLVTESLGQQFEGEFEYWIGQTRVEVKKTTDLIIDNVGYEYWQPAVPAAQPDPLPAGFKTAIDLDENPMSEPINLKLDGDKGGTHVATITYEHLTEKNYGPLFA